MHSPIEETPARDIPPPPNDRSARRFARRCALVAAGLFAILLSLLLILAAAIDDGLFDHAIARWMSRLSGRTIRYGAIHAHFLSGTPSLEIDDLTIANPPGFPAGDLARIRRLTATIRPARVWRGSLGIDTLHLDGVLLSLIRFGPNHNNWSSAHPRHSGAAFAPLAGIEDFQVSDGRLRFHDLARDLDISGPFAIGTGRRPFRLHGAGVYGGAPIAVEMAGGALHGAAVGRPYPFQARLIDGRTRIDARGASTQPFDLSAYRLAVAAEGPNLADIGYLFHLIAPNTAPYRLTALVGSGGGILRVDRIDIRSGASHVTGQIRADHRDPRRDIRARFAADRLDRADIDAMLASLPPRAAARDRSGAVPPGPPGRFLISAAPLGVARLRAADFDFDIAIARLTGYALPVRALTTQIDLDHGLLDLPRFHASLFGGVVSGNARIDARPAVPRLRATARFAGMQLAEIAKNAAQRGSLDAQFDLAGTGASLHDAAAHAAGSAGLRVSAASVPKAAGWMIGGDLLRAATASLGGAHGEAPTSVAAPDFRGRDGHFVSNALTARSAAGIASGNVSIDLGTERFCAYLAGRPFSQRLFQVTAPFRIEGPWLAPTVTILPGRKASALGLHGKAGLLLTPLAGLLPIKPRTPRSDGCS